MLKAPSVFPPQKISKSKKDKEWQESCVKYVVSLYRAAGAWRRDMEICTDLYNGIYDQKDLEYVTNPYRVTEGFPAKPQAMNIIKSRIDALIGEEASRPMILKVTRTSQDAASEAQDAKKKMLERYVLAKIEANMSPEAAMDFERKIQSGEVMPPEAIQRYMEYDYKDMAETTSYHAMNYLEKRLNLPHEFLKGWAYALKTGVEVYFNSIVNGEPFMEAVDPREFACDMSPGIEFIEDGWWACRHMRMSFTDIHDRYYDFLSDSQLDDLLHMAFSGKAATASQKGSNTIDAYWNFIQLQTGGGVAQNNGILDVYHTTWRSFKKVGFITYQDETGSIVQDIVSEDYVKTGSELNIEWKWVSEVWEGVQIGNGSVEDMFIAIRPVEYQQVSFDNLNDTKLPYSGAIYNRTQNGPKSLVSTMKPLYYMYIVLWYRLELALAKDKGRILNMDLTQVPKSLGITVQQWLHYIDALGINFFNPYETGWDIPGREGGRPAAFNQFASQDLSSGAEIAGYIQLMDKIEDMLGDLSGVSRQRLGQILASETSGNVNTAIRSSVSVTMPLIWMHSQAKKNAMKMLLNSAKEAWKQSEKKKLNYILDDGTRAFLDISDTFLNEDVDIFIIDATQEQDKINQIRSLSQYALSSGATMLDVVEIMTNDNLMMMKKKLQEIAENRAKQEAAAQEQQQAAAQERNQIEAQKAQAEQAYNQQKLELEKYKIDSENQTKIAVEEIRSYFNETISDLNNNGISDAVEVGDLQLRQLQHDADIRDKEMEKSFKQRELETKKEVEDKKSRDKKAIEDKKINLAEKQMEHEIALENLKAKHNMEVEKLKSRTALRNKTPGESSKSK